jgi:hypothetical protein
MFREGVVSTMTRKPVIFSKETDVELSISDIRFRPLGSIVPKTARDLFQYVNFVKLRKLYTELCMKFAVQNRNN